MFNKQKNGFKKKFTKNLKKKFTKLQKISKQTMTTLESALDQDASEQDADASEQDADASEQDADASEQDADASEQDSDPSVYTSESDYQEPPVKKIKTTDEKMQGLPEELKVSPHDFCKYLSNMTASAYFGGRLDTNTPNFTDQVYMPDEYPKRFECGCVTTVYLNCYDPKMQHCYDPFRLECKTLRKVMHCSHHAPILDTLKDMQDQLSQFISTHREILPSLTKELNPNFMNCGISVKEEQWAFNNNNTNNIIPYHMFDVPHPQLNQP
jgi:hypothetical protein